VACPSCGRPVPKPDRLRPAGLQIKAASAGEPPPLITVGAISATRFSDLRQRQETRRRQYRFSRRMEAVTAWLVFALLLGLLLGWQQASRSDPRLLQAYLTTRWLLIGATWLAVLGAAFADNKLQGLLCLFVPAYMIYFALNRMDYYLLRCLFFAALCALVAEFYFFPDQALLDLVQQQIQSWIQAGHRWITSLGREPV